MVKAECTWGEGPDVLVVGKKKDKADVAGLDWDHQILLMEAVGELDGFTHGTCGDWQLNLTAQEALQLATDLMIAARGALILEEGYTRDVSQPSSCDRFIADGCICGDGSVPFYSCNCGAALEQERREG